MQNTDVPLDFVASNYNKYIKAGTKIIPPPVENSPLTIPANNPIVTFFIFSNISHLAYIFFYLMSTKYK